MRTIWCLFARKAFRILHVFSTFPSLDIIVLFGLNLNGTVNYGLLSQSLLCQAVHLAMIHINWNELFINWMLCEFFVWATMFGDHWAIWSCPRFFFVLSMSLWFLMHLMTNSTVYTLQSIGSFQSVGLTSTLCSDLFFSVSFYVNSHRKIRFRCAAKN